MNSLMGKRIVVTRAVHQAAKLEHLLRKRGATPLLYPCISIKPPQNPTYLNKGLRMLHEGAFDWLIITSTNTVRALKQGFDSIGIKSPYALNVTVAAVGPATSQYAEEELGLKVQIIPERYTATALAQALHFANDTRILLPQSEIAEPILAATLSNMGAKVTVVNAYQTVIGTGGIDLPAMLTRREVDAITLTSASTVMHLFRRLQTEGGDAHLLAKVCIACMGANTTHAARENDLQVNVIPSQHTLHGLVTALEAYHAELATGKFQ